MKPRGAAGARAAARRVPQRGDAGRSSSALPTASRLERSLRSIVAPPGGRRGACPVRRSCGAAAATTVVSRRQVRRTGLPRSSSAASMERVAGSAAAPSSSAAGVEVDDEPGGGAEVDDLATTPRRRAGSSASGGRRRGEADHADLLRPDAERARPRRRAARPPSPSSRLEVPTKPATNGGGRVARRARPGVPTCSIRPVVEHRDPVAHRERLLLVVGDEDEGDADLALDLP